ncbi:hypothetical protein [Caloranaerobacter sp. DY30410]|uniref:hypothetical protein n=1 Tax=Caloranaerobacter sp. DY30410 TaxID=3238305 RepID=UPI003D01FA96
MRYITGKDRNQFNLIPICFDEIIAEDNPVRVIDAYVDKFRYERARFYKSYTSQNG